MMDALSVLVKAPQEQSVSAKSGKSAKGGEPSEKGSFSQEIKGLRGDERGGKDTARNSVSEEEMAVSTENDDAGADAKQPRKVGADAGLRSFASLRVELQAAADGTSAGTAALQNTTSQGQDPAEGVTDKLVKKSDDLQFELPGEEIVLPNGMDKSADLKIKETKAGKALQNHRDIKDGDFSDAVAGKTSVVADPRLAGKIVAKAAETIAETPADPDMAAVDVADLDVKSDAGNLAEVLGLLASSSDAKSVPDAKRDNMAELRAKPSVNGAETMDQVAGNGDESSDAQMPVGADQTDRVFRLSRGEGRGQSVDLKIASDSSGRVDVEARMPASGQAETVNVVEARRYLGFNAPSNSSSLTAALAGNDEWVSAMHPSARLANAAQQSSTGQVVNTLKLELNPHALGTVTAILRLSGDELNVHLTVHTAAAFRELKEDSSGMLEALRSQGFSVDQVSVSMAPVGASQDGGDTTNRFSQQQQQNMQQAAGEGSRNGDQSARQNARQEGSDGLSGVASGRGDEGEQNASVARSGGGARPSHVYI